MTVSECWKRWNRTAVWQILGGLALFASFWFPPLAFIGLIPASLLANRPTLSRYDYLAAWLGGLAFFLPGVQWLRYCDESAWLGWLLLALYLSLYLPAFVWLTRTMTRNLQTPLLLAAPAAWVALEYLRMHALTGFGWLLLAHSVHTWLLLLQIADMGGVYAVSLVIALTNAALAEWMTTPGRRPHWKVALPAITWALTLAYGSFRLGWAQFADGPTVILVQTNLPQRLKLDNTDETFKAVESVSARANDVAGDLVIWPETSYPYMYGAYDPKASDDVLFGLWKQRFGPPTGRLANTPRRKFIEFVKDALDTGDRNLNEMCDLLRKPLLVSVLRYELSVEPSALFNSAVLFAPKKGKVAHYDKLHLVPFGEYVPLKHSMPFLKILLPYDTETMGVDEGAELKILQHGPLNFAPTICFEDTLPHIGRGFMRARTPGKPVDFFVSQCNDGWFQGSVEGELHLAASIFRCIECRRAMVRSANMCVTAAIDPNGRVFARLPKHAEEFLKVVVPIDRREAPYVLLGDWLPIVCWLMVSAGLLQGVRRRFWPAPPIA